MMHDEIYIYGYIELKQWYIQGVTEIQVQKITMPIKNKNKTFYKNDKKRLTA